MTASQSAWTSKRHSPETTWRKVYLPWYKRTIPFLNAFCASQIKPCLEFTDYVTMVTSLKVKQHVVLLPNTFFAGACLGCENEARNYLPSDGANVHSSLAHIQCMEQGIAVKSGNCPITIHTQNITQVQSNIVDSLVGRDDFTRKMVPPHTTVHPNLPWWIPVLQTHAAF